MNLKSILGTVAALAFTATAATAEIKIGFAAEAYPPFTAKNSAGEWEGWEVDMKDALCAAMEEECVVVDVAWDGIIPALLGGKIDAIIASMSITDERKETINFSDKYYNTPAVLVAPKSMDIGPDSIGGKIVGVQVSTIHQNYAEKHFGDATIKSYSTFDEHNQDLVAGRVDAVVADSLAFSEFLKATPDMEVKAELIDEEIFGPGAGVGLRKEDTELADKFNAAIKQIREDGTYEEISKKYFDFDIYGG
ncbi:transporter substrate-binding domain-containing protein [Lentibacter sp. XHP0401]|jgi:polar amino acid transport system substrate-binding protein|uniref:transporter substrate-binding domain-containing protein n=1 Tax=Lentibacter sp. XHP0401 TaxID=2984334 RepID=UPI0021E8EAF7|nr:transporter substrate-binding domain-containing protein [Lentibacter sp. XHP0401]MCV2894183.1 transporter substrate-binding domain-containing protein [Lentibacter sp. XHP0401]